MGRINKTIASFLTLIIAISFLPVLVAEAYDLPLSPERIIPGGNVEPDAFTQPPTILFLSNVTAFNSSDISLPIQIKVGDSISAQSNQIDLFYYKGDWQNNNTELYRFLPQFMNGSRPQMSSIQEYSTTINLTSIPKGNHTLTLYVGEIGSYIRNQNNLCYSYSFMINKTSTIAFFIDTNGTTEPKTPTPSLPEISWFVIVLLLLSVFAVAEVVMHRKTANLGK